MLDPAKNSSNLSPVRFDSINGEEEKPNHSVTLFDLTASTAVVTAHDAGNEVAESKEGGDDDLFEHEKSTKERLRVSKAPFLPLRRSFS